VEVKATYSGAMSTPDWGTPEIHVRFAIPVNTQGRVSNRTIRKLARRRLKDKATTKGEYL